MPEMTKELFLTQVKFFHKSHYQFKFNCEKMHSGDFILCISFSEIGVPEYFGNIIKIDNKGFSYLTYAILGKRIKSRILFADLVPLVRREASHV